MEPSNNSLGTFNKIFGLFLPHGLEPAFIFIVVYRPKYYYKYIVLI